MSDIRGPESDVVTGQLRRKIALYGRGQRLPACEVTCVFLVTLSDDPMKATLQERVLLVGSSDRDLLERVHQGLVEKGGNCGEITEPPARKGEGLSMRFCNFDTFYRADDSLHRHFLEESVRTGKRCWHRR